MPITRNDFLRRRHAGQKYLEGLGRKTAAKIDNKGHLALDSEGNTTCMRFRNGEVAP